MSQVFAFPASPLAFINSAVVWQLKAGNGETASITFLVPDIFAGNQLDYRMFVEIYDGNQIEVRHGQAIVGYIDAAGDTNGSNTATHNGQEVTIASEGPCHHVISSFTFDVAVS